jgi:hypothetical protein
LPVGGSAGFVSLRSTDSHGGAAAQPYRGCGRADLLVRRDFGRVTSAATFAAAGESSRLPENCSQGLLAASVYQGNDMTMKNNFPKILAAVLAGCFVASVQAQLPTDGRPNDARITINPVTGRPPDAVAGQEATSGRAAFESRLRQLSEDQARLAEQTRFDLVFKGGTPKQFIEAINAQSGLKVNVIIPTEHANEQLPAVEVYSVTVPQVFQAVYAATKKTVIIQRNGQARGEMAREYAAEAFKSFHSDDKPPSETSIWRFVVESPVSDPEPPARVSVEVFQLASLLTSHSVDEITTAVKTTWQMMEESVTPELKYHSDTGLLIAKGTGMQLQMVNQVLRQLLLSENSPGAGGAGVSAPGRPVPSQP